MKTHSAWILALASLLASAASLAVAQNPQPFAAPSFATVSAGQPIAQVSYEPSCGACDGAGCGICGGGTAAPAPASSCGCGSGGCGGGCGPSGGLGHGGGLGLGGGMGLAQAGQMMQAMHAGGAGFGSQMMGQQNGPFGNGGCCTPIWYDFAVDYMFLRRERSGRNIDLTSDGVSGPIVLATDDLDMDDAHGFRATYALLIGPSSNLEFTYFGVDGWEDERTVTGNANLHSIFSDYGTLPSGNLNITGLPQTVDEANLHRVGMDSSLDNFELNLRRRWQSANCLLHGSYIAGVRYLRLDEKLRHDTSVSDGGLLDLDMEAENQAVGFQLGGDTFVCVSPRFKLGFDWKAGVYGNDVSVDHFTQTLDVENVNGNIVETRATATDDWSENDVAFIGELGAKAMFRVSQRMMITGGYSLMYLDGFATATDNFALIDPFNAPRQTTVDNEQDLVYHGASLGMTFTW